MLPCTRGRREEEGRRRREGRRGEEEERGRRRGGGGGLIYIYKFIYKHAHTQTDEYDDCKGTFKMNVSSGPVTAVELALYKLPSSGKDMTKLYYVFIQYGTKRSTLYVPGSALGWQVVALQGATSEASDAGELDVLVAVYTGGSGFLLCSAVKSVFSVVGSGDYSPMLAVYTNASSSNNNSTNSSTNNINSSSSDGDGGGGALVYDTQNQNHSYIAFVSSARSECDTKPTRICYSNVNFSFKTFNRGR